MLIYVVYIGHNGRTMRAPKPTGHFYDINSIVRKSAALVRGDSDRSSADTGEGSEHRVVSSKNA